MKRNHCIITLYLLNFILLGCSKNKSESPLDEFSDTQTKTIKVSKIIDLEKYEIYKPCAVFKAEGGYIIENQEKENKVNIIDENNNRIIRGINAGESPFELVSPSSFHKQGEQLFIYDISRKIIYEIHEKEDSLLISEKKRLEDKQMFFMVYPADESYITLGIQDSWIASYDKNNVLSSSIAFPEFESIVHLNNMEKAATYMSSVLTVKPDGSKIACAPQIAGAISFCNLNSGELSEYKRLEFHGPTLTTPRSPQSPAVVFSRDNKNGFCGATSDNDYVFLLYSGRTYKTHGMANHHCEHLLIYKWDGTPIKHLILEKPIYGTPSFDSATRAFYGIGYNPEGVILEYDLKNII